MLPDMADVLTEWEIPVKLKTVTRQTVDFVDADVVVVSDIKAVVQVAQKERLNTDAIDWSLRYLQIHSKEQLTVGQFIEFEGEDYKIIDDGNYQLYGFSDVVAEQTKRPLIEEPAPAPTCAITLTGDIAADFGGQPMTISGQTASYTLTETPTPWLASTPSEATFSPPASGVVVCEVATAQTEDAVPRGAVYTPDAVKRLITGVTAYDPGTLFVSLFYGSNEVYGDVFPATSVVALGVSSSGDAAIFVDGVAIELSGAGGGFFASGFALVAVDESGGSAGSGSITFRTAGADITQTYPAGTLDWCGNAIGATP